MGKKLENKKLGGNLGTKLVWTTSYFGNCSEKSGMVT